MSNTNTEILFSQARTLDNPQIELLKQYFPNCFDKNGDFLIEKFREIIQNQNINIQKEHYQFNWLGKSYAKILRELPPNTLLTADNEHNSQPKNQNSQNLLIQGDNLEVLKHLKNAYTNAIKMIYIDPPYNTGSDGFVYQDDRKFTVDELMQLGGMDKDEAERVLNFTTKKSNSHSAWLTFMYPRLYVAKELLKEDGVIFISIDDNEHAQLKILCDEVFGEENFVANFAWRKRTAKSDVPFGISQDYEWVICYAFNKFIAGTLIDRKYYETDDFPNDRWRLSDLTTQKIEADRPNSAFDLIDPKTGKIYPYNPNRLWGITKDTFQEYYKKGKIVFPDDYEFLKITIPAYRVFESEDKIKSLKKFGSTKPMKAISTLLPKEVGMTEDGNSEIIELFSKKIFSFPKPTSLLKYIIDSTIKDNDIILDFFAGSGTTAHAVMQLNAEDNGNRQFICVQLPELTDKKSEAHKAGYQTIFEITKARIQKAGEKIQNDNPSYQGDLGFKIFKTAPDFRNLENWELNNTDLFNTITFDDEQLFTLLTTWQIFDGFALTECIQKIKLDNYTAYLIGQNLYLLNQDFNTLALKELLLKLDNDKSFCLDRIIFLGWHFDSTTQKELAQAIHTYANKKSLKLTVLARY